MSGPTRTPMPWSEQVILLHQTRRPGDPQTLTDQSRGTVASEGNCDGHSGYPPQQPKLNPHPGFPQEHWRTQTTQEDVA